MLLSTDLDDTLRSTLATGTWILGFGIAVLLTMALLGEVLRSLGRAHALVRAVDLSTPLGLRRVAATIVAVVAGSVAPALAAAPPATTSTISVRSWLNGEAAGELGGEHAVAGLPVAGPTGRTDGADIPSSMVPNSGNADRGGRKGSLPTSGLTYAPRTGSSEAPAAQARVAASGTTYVVVPGDSLWRIASRVLGSNPSNRQIDAAWRRIYAANATAIGSDPGLIRPGLNLTLPPLD